MEIDPEQNNTWMKPEKNQIKLHLGSGDISMEGWINVDLNAANADLHLDLRDNLPFQDSSVAFIFSEHFIEHISREEGLQFLKECYRVLTKDGTLRLSTPSLKYLATSYLTRNLDEWGELWHQTTPCISMNEGMRSWGHKFLYDEEELVHLLSEAGFTDIRFVKWRESSIDDLVGLESRPFHHEIIVESSKKSTLKNSRGTMPALGEDEPWMDTAQKLLMDKALNLEQIVTDRVKYVNGQLISRDQTIAHLSEHIRNVETDWAARGQVIEEMAKHIRNVETDWAARGQVIEGMSKQIRSIEAEGAIREKYIGELQRTIQTIEAELEKCRSSLYCKLKSLLRDSRHGGKK